jgi:hypothetical protein
MNLFTVWQQVSDRVHTLLGYFLRLGQPLLLVRSLVKRHASIYRTASADAGRLRRRAGRVMPHSRGHIRPAVRSWRPNV